MSTAEAIGVALESALRSNFFGSGTVTAAEIAHNIVGSVVKEDKDDLAVLKEYNTLVAKARAAAKGKEWDLFYKTMNKIIR